MGNILNKKVLSEEITTKYGKIVGRRIIHEGDCQINAFQGVPFAKAPVGELRFKRPLPPVPWNDVRDCTAFGSRCIQKDKFLFDRIKGGICSEDCLHLNVFSPSGQSRLFPVLVFVHGGAFTMDSTVKYGDIGIARHLVAECELVVVTIEYRLGYLGFFSTGDSACDDNVALWDATMALQWIQDNIEQFHGDKNNVTLMGQSAGGAIVDLLSLSPFSRDLFHKVIPMAGNADCGWAINYNAVETSRQLANTLGVNTLDSAQLINELQKVDATKMALGIIIDSEVTKVETVVGPRIDGIFLPKPVSELRSEAPKKKRLIGVCEYEGLLFSAFDKKVCLNKLESKIACLIPEKKHADFKKLRKDALNLYIAPSDYDSKQAVDLAMCNFFSDLFLNNDVQVSVYEQLRVDNDETYLYRFDHFNSNQFGIFGRSLPFKGAMHCTELNYLLDIRMFWNYTFNEIDNAVLKIITKLWSNFAKYGDPNGVESEPASHLPFKWLPVSKENPSRYLSIKAEPQMCDNFQEGRPNFWIKLGI